MMSETRKIRVAVVGGGIGQTHISAFQSMPERFEVVALCDLDEIKAHQIAERQNIPLVVTDINELYRRDDLDVIDLCTPPFLHFEQVQAALAAGKNVICEKPVVGSLQELDMLLEAEAHSGKRVMPIFQCRFGNGLQKLKFLQDEGLTGRAYVSTVEVAWRRRAEYYAVPWRGKWQTELGGALLSHAIHAHDMLTYLLGPAKSVFARTKTLVNPIEVEDCASVSLEMADGSLASLSVTLGSAKEITRHRLCFSKLTAESNLEPYANYKEPWQFTPDTPELAAQIEAALARYIEQPEGHHGQFYRYAEALRLGTELPVTLLDARQSLELITAMYYSAQTGQPVELPIGSDHPMYAGWSPPVS